MPRSSAVLDHAPRVIPNEPVSAPSRAPEPSQRLGLTPLDQLAAAAFTGADAPDAPEVLELTRSAADALADEAPGAARGARRRLLARHVAIEKTGYLALLGTLGEHVRQGLHDEHAVRVARLLDGLATSSCRRMAILLGVTEQRATAVAIENAFVNVEAAE